MKVIISQEDLLNRKNDALIFLLPKIVDFEDDEVNLQLEAPDGEAWIRIIDVDKAKAIQINPILVGRLDNGLHKFKILVGDDQTL